MSRALALALSPFIVCWELARLGVLTGFRFSGPYWTWRLSTALGPDGAANFSRAARLRATWHYALWVARIRGMR